MAEIFTASAILSTWKLLGVLNEKYSKWLDKLKSSKKEIKLKQRAEELMKEINASILSGSNSDDADMMQKVNEFKSLIEAGVKGREFHHTEKWIGMSKKTPTSRPASIKATARVKKAILDNIRLEVKANAPAKKTTSVKMLVTAKANSPVKKVTSAKKLTTGKIK